MKIFLGFLAVALFLCMPNGKEPVEIKIYGFCFAFVIAAMVVLQVCPVS